MKLAPRLVLALLVALGAGCATRDARVADLRQLVGVWEGWLIGANDSRPAVLAIREDGTFDLEARLVNASGVVKVTEGTLGFEGPGPWHGTLTLGGDPGRRTLGLERADRAFRGRFVLKDN